MIDSFLLGLFISSLLFLACALIVIGAKTVIIAISLKYLKREPEPTPVVKKARKRTVSKKPPTPFRSIEINPEEIDRIYVKKSS